MNTSSELLILCENLKFLRKTNKLSQKEMAKLCGISVNSLRRLESGIIPPKITIEFIFNASSYFKIPSANFFIPLSKN